MYSAGYGSSGKTDSFPRAKISKRQTGAKVSTSHIDECYEKAIAAGALGGKLLGAGGGGFFIFYVPKDRQQAVTETLKDLLQIPFEFSDTGSEIIYESEETGYITY